MKKVLYVWKGHYPFEIRIQKIVESLASKGYDTTLLCKWTGEEKEREVINGVKVIRVGYRQSGKLYLPLPYNPYWKKAISQVVAEIKPGLVINREFFLMTETAPVCKKRGIPLLIDMAENYPAAIKEFATWQTNNLKKTIRNLDLPKYFEKWVAPKADGIIVVCDEQIPRLANIGIKPENIGVVHNTPNFRLFDINDTPDRSDSDKFIFFHHGMLSRDKTIDIFLEAFLQLAENMNIELRVAGHGEYLDFYKSIANKYSSKDKVKFLGKYQLSELRIIAQNCDCGVLPFKYNDFNNYTIHNKIFDYLAFGLPVFVSQCEPLKRIINETNAGVIGDCSSVESCKNAIITAIEDIIANRDTYSQNATKAYESKYNWSIDEQNLIKFISKFIH